ncbi:MAG: DUF4271 domain-containing protein [Saprospiraceae bacterium]|nr:DUF4271 domain-containing protein [Saprospiraceae bacterium]
MQCRSLLALLFAHVLVGLHAQRAASNPFDIEARLPKQSVGAAQSAPSLALSEIAANPFNVVPHRRANAEARMEPPTALQPVQKIATRSAFGPSLTEGQIFWLLVGLLAFLAFAVASKRDIVVKSWRAFLNDNALNIALREASGLIGSTPYYLLYASFLLNAGMFVFLIARHFNPDTFNRIGFLLLCLLGAPLLFVGKHALVYLVGILFPLQAEMRRYSFLIMLFNCVLGLFLMPFNFLLTSQRPYSGFLVFWLLALAGIFYLYRYLRASTIAAKFLPQHLFHFLLYLCSVEFAPVLILVKLVFGAS